MTKALSAALYTTTALTAAAFSAGTAGADGEYAALARAGQWEFLDDYCTKCHNFEDYSGGLDFTTMFVEEVPDHPEVWEKAVRKLNARMMPPPGQEKPPEKRIDTFVAWLEDYLDEAGSQTLVPERVPIHRLNRKEYANAVRDLLGIEIDPAAVLPKDNVSEGFDNIAGALQVSPAFIDQYVSAARRVVEEAVGDKSPGLGSMVYTPEEALPQRALGGGSQQFHIEGLPLGTRGGMLIEHWFPANGEYAVSVGDFNLYAWMYNIEFENTLIVTVDGEKVFQTVIGGDKDRIALDKDQGAPLDDINSRAKDIRFTTTAGPHNVGVTFVRRSFAESDDRLEHFIEGSVQDRILSIPSVEIRGPFNPAGLSSTPSREKIFTCYPETPDQEAACARRLITDFATRAYRRPLTDEDMAPLLAFYERGHASGGFEEGIRQAFTRALASPHFLYRTETAPAGTAPGEAYALDSLALASRLSFFLWSSIPDRELLELAMADQLTEPAVLEAQVKRMLADPKSLSLAANFAYQWLNLSKLDEIEPDPNIFPYAAGAGDPRPEFKKEIELFVDSIFREDRGVLDLLNADHTFVNEKIAQLYDIKTVKGNRFHRVKLENPWRWGLLGKGAILMVSAYPNRTSPVLRGAYVLENIMGTPPPIPPPDVPDLKENEAGKPATTVRERLEQHRQDPVCNSCHAVLDPLGFALENFDAVGRWREKDRFTGTHIDSSGVLPNGRTVDGPLELRQALLERPELFVRSLTENLLTYALGRPVEARDMPAIRAIVDRAATDDYRFSTLVMGILDSPAFRMQKAPESSSIDEGIAATP